MSEQTTPENGPRPASDRKGVVNATRPSTSYEVFRSGLSSTNISTPSVHDPTEFPSLPKTNSDTNIQLSVIPSAKPNVGLLKESTSGTGDFTMVSADFPPLQGSQSRRRGGSQMSSEKDSGGGSEGGNDSRQTLGNKTPSKPGIVTSSDGRVSNIPASMLTDQFGMAGLLSYIRGAETNPHLVSHGLGQDLTALGLNLNDPDNLYPTFGGPWESRPCRAEDIDFDVPPEYLINASIRRKLPYIDFNRYNDDQLFYFFYKNVKDVLQIAAASELYNREWRYHTVEKKWLTQVPGMVMTEKMPTYERGTYYFFYPSIWRKIPREFLLEYNKLEGRPILSPMGLRRDD